jgi:hypothetical protein
MKQNDKERLFEVMHKVAGLPLINENIEENNVPKLGSVYKEGESYLWKNQKVFVDENKETLIFELLISEVIKYVAPELTQKMNIVGNQVLNLPSFDDQLTRNQEYSSMYRQSGGDEFYKKYDKISKTIYRILNYNINLTVVMEKSQANPKDFVPVEHISGFNKAIEEISKVFNVNKIDLSIDIGKLLQKNFIEIDN